MDESTPAVDLGDINRTLYLGWFTNTLDIGYTKKLAIEDLPPLPLNFESQQSKKTFQAESMKANNLQGKSPRVSVTNEYTHSEKWVTHLASAEVKNKYGVVALVRVILRCYGWSIAKAGVLKALTTALSFVGPILLGYIVKYLENGVTMRNLHRGILLIALLAGSSVTSAILNTNYNIRMLVIKTNMQGALVRIVFTRCLSLPIIAKKELFLSDSQVNNLVQVDVDQVSNCVKSIHDLWALPVQIIVACALLYLNIKVAFLAGVFIIVIMIPLNSEIAKRIGSATDSLMKAKDARIKIVTEALGNVVSMKMAGLEGAVLGASGKFRTEEVHYLAQRKYLDAVCVFLWALTPVIVPFVTFLTTAYMNVDLSASDVITAIALLNMLIFPMNALPWVINGFMEARVSIRRLAKVLSSEDGQLLHVHNRFARKTRHRVTFAADPQAPPVEIFSSESRSRSDSGSSNGEGPGKDGMVLSIPTTVWSWSTTYQAKALLDAPVDPKYQPPTADVEAQTLSPLLTASEGDAESGLGAPFAVSINEVKLRPGQLMGIVGSTGSGKSSLLLGILGEIRGHKRLSDSGGYGVSEYDDFNASFSSNNSRSFSQNDNISGNAVQLIRSIMGEPAAHRVKISLSTGNVGYCPQVPAMHSGSIRSNILMGCPLEHARYMKVLAGCCLLQDLQTGSWEKGDLTDVGAGGSNLSGGQRLRIGVARAVYAYSCDLLLLDDPFAALDSATAGRLTEYLYNDVVKQQGRTVVIATHSLQLLRNADILLLLQHGEEKCRGTFEELQAFSPEFQLLLGEQVNANLAVDTSPAGHLSHGTFDDSAISRSRMTSRDSTASHTHLAERVSSTDGGWQSMYLEEEPDPLVALQQLHRDDDDGVTNENAEFSATGYLDRRVYVTYLAAVGVVLTLSIVLTTLLMQGCSIGLSFWWAYWATHQDEFTRRDFVLISSGLVLAALIAGLLRSVLFAKGGLNAAVKLYDRLSTAVFHTDIKFFESTPVGRLTNRFGKDSNTIDDSLPFIMNILLAQCFLLLGSCFVMAVNDPPILVLLVIVAVIYHRMQRYYRKSSRELRRLDSIHKSPVYTIFLECMESAPILRGFGEQCVCHFDTKLQRHLDASLRVSLSVDLASQWLGVRLQLLGALITTILATSIVLNGLYNTFPMNAGMAGLSLIYSFTIINNLNGFLNALSETEQEMVSVERVLEYSNLPNEFGETLETQPGQAGADGKTSTTCASCCAGWCACCWRSKYEQVSGSSTDFAYSRFSDSESDSDGSDDEEGRTGSHHRRQHHDSYPASPSDLSNSLTSVLLINSHVGGTTKQDKIKNDLQNGQHRPTVVFRIIRNQEGMVFEGVSMSYASSERQQNGVSDQSAGAVLGSADVLKELSITIRPGSRVAVVGRTGSGKSSLLRVLLRINDYHSGTITLSGTELRSIPKQRLRSKLSIIPQKPLLFTGTIRFNLDPLGKYAEADLCAALEMCKIAQTLNSTTQLGSGRRSERGSSATVSVERFTDITLRTSTGSNAFGTTPVNDASAENVRVLLDFQLTEGGANLSVGQQQLLCLARALLRRSDLILVDEATASVDAQTESLLYASLAQYIELTGASMLMVCHKLSGVHKVCNKVLTLDDGRIVSYEDIDEPLERSLL